MIEDPGPLWRCGHVCVFWPAKKGPNPHGTGRQLNRHRQGVTVSSARHGEVEVANRQSSERFAQPREQASKYCEETLSQYPGEPASSTRQVSIEHCQEQHARHIGLCHTRNPWIMIPLPLWADLKSPSIFHLLRTNTSLSSSYGISENNLWYFRAV